MDIVSHEQIVWHNGEAQSNPGNSVCLCVFLWPRVYPPVGVRLQRSNVKAGLDTVNNGGSNILTFSMKSHRGSLVTQEIGPCHRKKGAVFCE